MKKVIVTGHKGFIGRSLLNELKRDNYDVYGLDESYFSEENWTKVLLMHLNKVNPDVVFHVGACSDTLEQNVDYMMTRNYESTKIIMDWCYENNCPMIYSSSAANYGINNEYPSNLYGWSKYTAEIYVISHGGIALRYFNVYGPGEEQKGKMASVAYQMHLRYLDGKDILLFPKKPQRDFVYVKDVVAANLFALENYQRLKGKYYEVGFGEARGFEDVLNNMGIKYEYTDDNKIPIGYQFYTCSNSNKWMDGWKPTWNLEDGIRDYKNYLESENIKIDKIV
jgi:ADP-L-glycero-D-manno-heptose 6-epimerase